MRRLVLPSLTRLQRSAPLWAAPLVVLGCAGLGWVTATPVERIGPHAEAARTRVLADSIVASSAVPGDPSTLPGGRPLILTAEGQRAVLLNARHPNDPGALRPARPFVLDVMTDENGRRALRCLTQAIYYEAALESTAGQEGVAQVVLNRVRDVNYPATVCGVVFEGAERTTGCQFSFTCDGALARPPVDWAWRRAETVARRALAGHVAARVGTATHYHADYVYPWWAPTLAKIDRIGTHIFYRWKGIYGETAAFRQPYGRVEPVIDEARLARARPAPVAADVAAPLPGETTPEGQAATGGSPSVSPVAGPVGRRLPTPEEIARINESLERFEGGVATPAASVAAPAPGVVPLEVEEVGRPPTP